MFIESELIAEKPTKDFDPGDGFAMRTFGDGESVIVELNGGGEFVGTTQFHGRTHALVADAHGLTALSDSALMRFDAVGSLLWSRPMTGDLEDATMLKGLPDGEVALAGGRKWESSGGFVARLDAAGGMVWSRPIDSGNVDDLTVDHRGRIWINGHVRGSDLGRVTDPTGKTIVVDLDRSGAPEWTRVYAAYVVEIAFDGTLGEMLSLPDVSPSLPGWSVLTTSPTGGVTIASWRSFRVDESAAPYGDLGSRVTEGTGLVLRRFAPRAEVTVRDGDGTWIVQGVERSTRRVTERELIAERGWLDALNIGEEFVGRAPDGTWRRISNRINESTVERIVGRWDTSRTWHEVVQVPGTSNLQLLARDGDGVWWLFEDNGTEFQASAIGRWNPDVTWREVRIFHGGPDGAASTDSPWFLIGRTDRGEWWTSRFLDGRLVNEHWATWNESAGWDEVIVTHDYSRGAEVLGRTGDTWWFGRNAGVAGRGFEFSIVQGLDANQGFRRFLWDGGVLYARNRDGEWQQFQWDREANRFVRREGVVARWNEAAGWSEVRIGWAGYWYGLVGRASDGQWWASTLGSGPPETFRISASRAGRDALVADYTLKTSKAAAWNESAGWRDVRHDDFDGDGRVDLLGRSASGQWWLSSTNADGASVTREWGRWDESRGWRDVLSGDLDGDGRLDVVGRTEAGEWWLGRGTETGFVNRRLGNWNEAAAWRDVTVADMDGDGRADVIGRTASGEWWLGSVDGQGNLTNRVWSRWNEAGGWADVRIVDLNADGRLDVLGRSGADWWVGLNDGSGFAYSSWGVVNPSAGWRDVMVADFTATAGLMSRPEPTRASGTSLRTIEVAASRSARPRGERGAARPVGETSPPATSTAMAAPT